MIKNQGTRMKDKMNNSKSGTSGSSAINRSYGYEKVPVKPPKKKTGLTGVQKTAILLVALGSDMAATLFQSLSESEVQLISKEIACLDKITHKEKQSVLEEFQELIRSEAFITRGGVDTAKKMLSAAFGEDKADKIFKNLAQGVLKKPFDFLNDVEPDITRHLLQSEHPQTIALTLSYLKADIASQVLRKFPQELQSIIAKRIATLEPTSPQVIEEMEKVLLNKLAEAADELNQRIDGVDQLAEILNGLDRDAEKNILSAIQDENEELAEEIKEKMFTFEDILHLTNRELQKVVEMIGNHDLAIALKGEEIELRHKFFANMTKGRQKEIKDEMHFLGPVRYRDVHFSQQKIINLLKMLDNQGEVILKNHNDHEYLI